MGQCHQNHENVETARTGQPEEGSKMPGPRIATDTHSEAGDKEKEEPKAPQVNESKRTTGQDQPQEQQETAERGKSSKAGEPTKLMPWAMGRKEEHARNKQRGQAEGALKNLGNRMKNIWRTSLPCKRVGMPDN